MGEEVVVGGWVGGSVVVVCVCVVVVVVVVRTFVLHEGV